jgi:hypothetical protein
MSPRRVEFMGISGESSHLLRSSTIKRDRHLLTLCFPTDRQGECHCAAQPLACRLNTRRVRLPGCCLHVPVAALILRGLEPKLTTTVSQSQQTMRPPKQVLSGSRRALLARARSESFQPLHFVLRVGRALGLANLYASSR